jgi:hypothetical protein
MKEVFRTKSGISLYFSVDLSNTYYTRDIEEVKKALQEDIANKKNDFLAARAASNILEMLKIMTPIKAN